MADRNRDKAFRRRQQAKARRQHYLAGVLDVASQVDLLPGVLYLVEVAHDDGCRRPDGGPCTCSPDVGRPVPWEG